MRNSSASNHAPAQTSQATVQKNSSQTAAVAGSVVTAIVVFTLVLVLVRLRSRKLRIRERRIPEQFLDFRERSLQNPPAKKGAVPIGAQSTEAEVNPSISVGDEAQLERPETFAPRVEAASVTLTDSGVGAAAAASDPQEATRELEEDTMTLRVRRLEAQMGALLAIGLPEGSPPSYSG
ncbi:hypothetical protein C8R45DRAFT_939825 [Mycena sanguinolenta]|nr:hypothetical protein C8R45DRAFT_939825 [Mycena sanguinolenta]